MQKMLARCQRQGANPNFEREIWYFKHETGSDIPRFTELRLPAAICNQMFESEAMNLHDLYNCIVLGLGIYSLFGYRFWRPEARRVDDEETLRFSLYGSGGFGDATDVEFEFASVRRGDEVKLQFFDDGELVDSTIATIVDGELTYAAWARDAT